jgi:hypothetical protein
MARVYGKRRKDPKIKTTGTRGFPLGLNQLTHPTTIKNTELAEAQNVLYSQNGVLSKRPGSVNLGEPRGESTKVLALQGVYNIGDPATDYLLRIADDGILQYYSFFSSTWIDVPSSPTFSPVDTQILQGYGFIYLLNPEDDMYKWDGNTFYQFEALPNPTTKPTLTKQGSETGAITYYYRYVWYNEVGNTLASDWETLNNMPEELDVETYVKVELPEAPEGTVRTGIFRGTIASEEKYLAGIPASQTVYNDKGFDEEDPLYGVPKSNTTGGFHFRFATVYEDTLIGVTEELGDDTLVFSAGGELFHSFGVADGGGYYSWRKDDGDPIMAVHAFQDELYIFKSQKVGAFSFHAEGATVRDINLAVGAVSHRSVHAAGNDLRFWSREGAYSLGNEPNFADLIRTKVLSARADQIVQSLTPTEFDQISGVFYKDHSLWGLPMGATGEGITSCIAYNEKYAAWTEWFGLTPNVWAKFVDSSNRERLFYGDAQSGNVVECWEGTDDRGDPIVWRVATKQFDMDRPHQYKTFGRVYFIFGNVTGTGTRITLVEDGVRTQVPLALYAETGDMGFGVDQWGTMEFGDSSGEFIGDVSGLTVRYVDLGNKDLFSLQAILTNAGISDQIEFMGMLIEYAESAQPLPASKRLNRVLE